MAETDRELLEKAARAAGYVVDWSAWDYTGLGVEDDESETGRIMPTLNGSEWNPLDNDGDALRLATSISANLSSGLVIVLPSLNDPLAVTMQSGNLCADGRANDADPYAATRRAIVRAAAAMGES